MALANVFWELLPSFMYVQFLYGESFVTFFVRSMSWVWSRASTQTYLAATNCKKPNVFLYENLFLCLAVVVGVGLVWIKSSRVGFFHFRMGRVVLSYR